MSETFLLSVRISAALMCAETHDVSDVIPAFAASDSFWSAANFAVDSGVLFVAGTPIGNLEDVSFRLKKTLTSADVIFCEDTRVSAKLLSALDIHTPTERADEHTIATKIPRALELLEKGSSVAYISDAGMPGISDPGRALVDAVLDRGFKVEVIPGPSALTAAVAISGLSCARFWFEGFLPRKKSEKLQRLRRLSLLEGACVVFESPFRLRATLELMAETMGDRRCALIRELTKLHEEVLRGTPTELLASLSCRDEIKGEIVLVAEAPVSGGIDVPKTETSDGTPLSPDARTDELIVQGLQAGRRKSELARELSFALGLDRAAVYTRILELAKQ